jgi:hypothetical protein
MQELIQLLNKKIAEIPHRCLFNPPATPEKLLWFEIELGAGLNDHVREFYLAFNGGFIADKRWGHDRLADPEMKDTIAWNSNYLLSLEEIIDSYFSNGFYSSPHLRDKEEEHGRKLIPIIHTSGQEILVLDITEPEKSGPVKDAFHEEPCYDWGTVYESFEELLRNYIEKEGQIKTIGS